MTVLIQVRRATPAADKHTPYNKETTETETKNVAALVSLYSLEIVLSRGGMPAAFHAVVGAGVCAVSLALGVYMIAAAARTLGRARKGGFAAPRDK